MKRTLTSLLVAAVLISCNNSEEHHSVFIENCNCKEIDFSDGFKITDSLNLYSVVVPNDKWKPWKNIDGNHSMIAMGDSIGEGFSIINITYASYEYKQYDWKSDFDAFESRLNYTDRGEKDYKGVTYRFYALEGENDIAKSFYFARIIEENNSLLTIFTSTTDHRSADQRLCELESILNKIEIL